MGAHCLNPNRELRPGHKCRTCKEIVHSVTCSNVDESRETSQNLQCFVCAIKETAPEENDSPEERGGEAAASATKVPPKKGTATKKKHSKSTKAKPTTKGPHTGSRKTANKKPSVKPPPKPPPKAAGKTASNANNGELAKRRYPNRAKLLTKTPEQKKFVLHHDNTPGGFIMKTVAFHVDDGKKGTELMNHLCGENGRTTIQPYLKKENGNE